MKLFRFYNFGDKKSIHHSLRLFGYSVWAFYRIKGFGWFRLFGLGLMWKDTSTFKSSFSERNGYVKGLKVGKWEIRNI